MKRYTAQPFEVSLVDLPCNPDAQFTVIKADGSEELRKFVTEPAKDEKDESEIAKAEHAAQLVKAADDLAKVSADLAKANDDLAKAADDLAKLTTERDDALAKLKASQDEIETLKQSAAAPKGAVRVVEKIEDNGGSLAKIDESPVLASDGSIDHVATAMKLMKVAHTRPMAGIR